MPIKDINSLHYKELFIYGAYLTVIVLALIGSIVDFILGNEDAYICIAYTVLTLLAFRYSHKKQNFKQSAVILFWISAFAEYLFLYINRVDFDIIFAILVPIIAFISMDIKKIILNISLYYAILAALLVYFYFETPNNIFLHNLKYMFAFVIANMFIISFGFFYHLAISKTVKNLQETNYQNRLLLKEVHHRVKNNLNLMASILGLQSFKSNCPILKKSLESSKRRIESMATLHEVLYKSSELKSLSLKEYINKLVSNIIQSESSSNVKVNYQIDSINLTINSLIQFGIMLNEMVTNSIKYAKEADGTIEINITFKIMPLGYKLIYCDNGKKVDINKLEKGFGFNLIKLTVEHFNGEMYILTEGGLCYNIYFKHLED